MTKISAKFYAKKIKPLDEYLRYLKTPKENGITASDLNRLPNLMEDLVSHKHVAAARAAYEAGTEKRRKKAERKANKEYEKQKKRGLKN
jgi:hypothetical protein